MSCVVVTFVLLVVSHIFVERVNRKRFQQIGDWLVELDQRLQEIEKEKQ